MSTDAEKVDYGANSLKYNLAYLKPIMKANFTHVDAAYVEQQLQKIDGMKKGE